MLSTNSKEVYNLLLSGSPGGQEFDDNNSLGKNQMV